MNYLSFTRYKEWLEDKMMFSFRSRKSAPPPPPPPQKSQAEKDADANRDRELRAEQYNARKTQVAGKRRRRGRSLLMYAKSGEAGVSDTLG